MSTPTLDPQVETRLRQWQQQHSTRPDGYQATRSSTLTDYSTPATAERMRTDLKRSIEGLGGKLLFNGQPQPHLQPGEQRNLTIRLFDPLRRQERDTQWSLRVLRREERIELPGEVFDTWQRLLEAGYRFDHYLYGEELPSAEPHFVRQGATTATAATTGHPPASTSHSSGSNVHITGPMPTQRELQARRWAFPVRVASETQASFEARVAYWRRHDPILIGVLSVTPGTGIAVLIGAWYALPRQQHV